MSILLPFHVRRIFEINKNSPEYQRIFNMQQANMRWISSEVQADLIDLFGVNMMPYLFQDPFLLRVSRLPSKYKDDFHPNPSHGCYIAKRGSELENKYFEILAKHKLEYYDISNGLQLFKHREFVECIDIYPPMLTKPDTELRFLLRMRTEYEGLPPNDEIVNYFHSHPSLSFIQAFDYLRLYADIIENYEKLLGNALASIATSGEIPNGEILELEDDINSLGIAVKGKDDNTSGMYV